MQKTFIKKPAEVIRNWHLVDASEKILGQVASQVAQLLIGKHKKDFTPHVDAGDFVVVINTSKVAVSGNKLQSKRYYRHSNYPGGLKSIGLAELLKKQPEKVIEKAVYNMLPKNKLRTGRMNRLKVYANAEHKHESQLAVKKD